MSTPVKSLILHQCVSVNQVKSARKQLVLAIQ